MIWKNPFISKNSEQQMNEEQFLSLFDCTALQIVEPQNLEKVSFVSSSPGAGKTSLFRAFSARVLNKVISPDSTDRHKDFKQQMSRLGVIANEQVFLNSAILSCARGYTIIDEMFQNGRRKQIFFALINYRIAIALLKSIGALFEFDIDNYNRIQFAHIPAEMYSNELNFQNGKALYDWACKGERDLCRYLDSERNDAIEISFVHATLLVLKLFEPDNILVDGQQYFHNTLIIFDDFHKLSEYQKKQISEAVYTLKTNVGVWFGQRLEGISNEQLISLDGSLNRDYNHNIIIDNFWPEKQKVFYGMLEQIADKRIKEAQLSGYNVFSDCIHEQLNINLKEYRDKLTGFCQKQIKIIKENPDERCKYEEIISYIEKSKQINILEQAIWLQCIIIQENRQRIGQLSFYLGEKTSLSEFQEFVKKNHSSASFYVCIKNKIPFYYGFDNLKVLSSYNVEQFLFFAGAYFDCCRIKSLEYRKNKRLSAEEQEKALLAAVNHKWNDMDYRFVNISDIKDFLNAIAKLCIRSRDAERAAYAGGAYTGIGIDRSTLQRDIYNSRYDKLRSVLGACLSSKYLERREINNGNIIVFYLNRWLCVYYGLPLSYGGWAKCNLEKLNRLDTISSFEENQEQIAMKW